MLARLKREYGDRVAFLSLTVEPQDTPEKIDDKFGADNGLTFARASEVTWQKLMPMGGEEVGTIPASVFITAEGNVAMAIVGDEGIEEAVKALLP